MLIRPEVTRSPYDHARSPYDQMIRKNAKPIVWLHVGAPKTGTTAVQVAFDERSLGLLRSGWLYPTAGRFGPGHHRLARAVSTRKNYAYSMSCFEQLRGEIDSIGASQIFISSEDFFLDIDVDALARHLESFNVNILAYIRCQKDWLRSYFAQFVKHEDYRFYDVKHDDNSVLDWLGELADYYDRLQAFAQTFGRDHVIVRNYDDPSIKRDVIRDVCTIVGIDSAAVDSGWQESYTSTTSKHPKPGASNISLNDDELEIVRLSNLVDLPASNRERWLYQMQKVALLRRDRGRPDAKRFSLGLDLADNRARLEVLSARNAALFAEFPKERNVPTELAANRPAKPKPLDLVFAPTELRLSTLAEVTAALVVQRAELNANVLAVYSARRDRLIWRKLTSVFRPWLAECDEVARKAWLHFKRIISRSGILNCFLNNSLERRECTQLRSEDQRQ